MIMSYKDNTAEEKLLDRLIRFEKRCQYWGEGKA